MKKLQFSALLVFGLILLSTHAYSQQSKLFGQWKITQTNSTKTEIGTVNFDKSGTKGCFDLRGTTSFKVTYKHGKFSFVVSDRNIKFENLTFNPGKHNELKGILIDGNASSGTTRRFAVVFLKTDQRANSDCPK